MYHLRSVKFWDDLKITCLDRFYPSSQTSYKLGFLLDSTDSTNDLIHQSSLNFTRFLDWLYYMNYEAGN